MLATHRLSWFRQSIRRAYAPSVDRSSRWTWVLVILALIAGQAVARADDSKPWRVRDAVGAPKWLDLGLEHRVRVEHLENDYRVASAASPTALVMRSLLRARATFDAVFLGFEIQDSRAYASDDAPINTTNVDALDLLQAHIGLAEHDLLEAGDTLEAQLGRITLDVGSRRLVARNRFRNTINGFTGLDAQWTSPTKKIARVFAVLPVSRSPSDSDSLQGNDIELDEENRDTLFWGIFYSGQAGLMEIQFELFALGLHERDGDLESRNRQLITPGLRMYRKPVSGRLDFEVDAVALVGSSRASTATDDTTRLDHRAFFAHAETGWTSSQPWSPRLVVQLDYASGDKNPNDEKNQRFDTLFGARRFDFGPTGIYGPFLRSNLNTPGMRLELEPHARVDAFAAYRLYWLASRRDAWPPAGLRDPAGNAGRFLGQQAEVRVRYHVLPKNLSLDLGAAHLIRGGFAVDAPDGNDTPSTYAYAQVTGTI